MFIELYIVVVKAMNICYWNVSNETPPDQLIEACVDLRTQEEIDVFCLQEVPYMPGYARNPASLAIAEALGMMGAFEHTRTLLATHDRLRGYGTAILANSLHSVRTKTIRNDSLAYMTPSDNNRRVLMTAKTYERPDLTVGVAHLSYKLPFGIGKLSLIKERSSLVEHLDNYRKESDLIFGGDMNCEPGDGLDDMLLGVGLCNLEAGSPTFKSKHWFAGRVTRDLDRVFVTRGLNATAELGDFGPSDHRPVIARVA